VPSLHPKQPSLINPFSLSLFICANLPTKIFKKKEGGLDKLTADCNTEEGTCLEGQKEAFICFPKSDSTSTEAGCVSPRYDHIHSAIQNGTGKIDAARIEHLEATCEPLLIAYCIAYC
jgi:hypothetical protein